MKSFLKLAAAALLLGGLASAPAVAQTEIRISTAAPDQSPLSDAFRMIKTRMEAKFPGQIRVSVHTASSLFRQGTELPAMQRGNLEMASPVTFEIEGQLPEYGVFSAAYLFRDADHLIKTFRSDIGKEFADDVASKMGIVILDTAYLGTRTVNLRMDKPVRLPGDLAGVKMRMPPGPAFQMLAKALGATAVSMPITEVYLGLKTGSIDAQDNPINMTRDWKFNEVTAQVILTRHLVQPVFFAIAKPAFDKLTPAQQAELRAASREAADFEIAKTLEDEKSAADTFRAAGIKIVEPDIPAFRAAVMEQYKESGMMARWKPGLAEKVEAIR
ncbi:MAG: TRAP transporter substrate-binding protein DctP [Alphaproteobacteria bacterium]|nr:TRAP transporter substrate-binding protein DctP [Alphaproteobacteria bacterium]